MILQKVINVDNAAPFILYKSIPVVKHINRDRHKIENGKVILKI